MERLLDELLHMIFVKLAVQDLLSLLSATCACKSFYRTVQESPSIWKEAFLASATGEQTQSLLAEETESALDAEICLLGGYKRLALMRARLGRVAKPGRFPFDQEDLAKNRLSEKFGGIRQSFIGGTHDVSRYLIFFKLRNKILGWKFH